ncbi:unnamed protein product [Enterobius vermicularis]|uniref:Uncharacterized protein n=1 Tax=Enterobius vermicularis TaxID=51028 RepID=A0A0N4VEF4_ENTVE|nr:unnamed protein product [Enterobius vermicularis]
MFRRHWGGLEDVRKRLRQLTLPRRVLVIVLCSLVALYFLISSIFSSENSSVTNPCILERTREWKELEESALASTSPHLPVFVGNGFVGLGGDGELRMLAKSKDTLSQKIAFFPLVDAEVVGASLEAKATVVDYRTGVAKMMQCFSKGDECVCVTRSFYAHRTRPHVIVQDIVITNPTDDLVEVKLTTHSHVKWDQDERVDKTYVYSRALEVDDTAFALGGICSFVPKKITVERKREESERFLCVVNYEVVKTNEIIEGKKRINRAVSKSTSSLPKVYSYFLKEFADILSLGIGILDRENEDAWRKLNTVTFDISKSLAPDVLNTGLINALRYGLLANVRAPLLEHAVPPQKKKEAYALMYERQESACYSGHSTLFVPSASLWKISSSVDNLVSVISVWIHTLQQNGCVNFVNAGASGVAQAFVLSLIAGKFTSHHLEIRLEPPDLHREITVEGIALSSTARFSLAIKLDGENRPYMLASSNSQMYACDAGCLSPPELLSDDRRVFPVKATKPLTPILYISENKRHLVQLRNTIHVSEVIMAPAHEQELIALHKHGHRLGGLPVAFWVLLGALVVIFHLFLFKLLYSEWSKADYTPYNYYLRQRYVRSH